MGDAEHRRLRSIHFYVAAVGLLAVGGGAAVAAGQGLGFFESPAFWVFAGLTFLGELWPLKVQRRDEGGAVTTSSTFAFAILLTAGPLAAVLAQGLACILADGLLRKGWLRGVFNTGQYILSLVAAYAVLSVVAGGGMVTEAVLGVEQLPALLAAGVVMFVCQALLTSGAVALASGERFTDRLRGDFLFNASTAGVLLTLSPALAVVAQRALPLIPLLLATVMALYRNASQSLQKEHAATHDLLTDLPNRRLFHERVDVALLEAKRTDGRVGLVVIDLDRFKEINDTLGHHVGDLVLQQIGPRLRNSVREIDTIARLGGDEFAVLLREVTTHDDAARVAERIVRALDRPVVVGGFPLDVNASVGAALYPDHGANFDVLMQRADVAMYAAKRDHLGAAVYSTDRDREGGGRLALLGQLPAAIENGELVLHYQPKVDLVTGRMSGVEALVRWQHPELGLIFPDEFIPLAEHTELIGPLSRSVLDMAIGQCTAWHGEGLMLSVAVNLSVQNLYDPQFAPDVRRLLGTWGLDAAWLELEITENTVMADPRRARGVLEDFGAMGVRVAIDDFGTGYSSLAHLRQLPVTTIKIDKSFVMAMTTSGDDAVIVRSIIDLARNLGLGVVAEGVETHEVWNLLAGLGCHHAQGYYLCRPVSAEGLAGWMHEDAERQRLADPLQAHAPRTPVIDSLAVQRARRVG
jgi:diguanylate cyclase (GGDEF)-like protein